MMIHRTVHTHTNKINKRSRSNKRRIPTGALCSAAVRDSVANRYVLEDHKLTTKSDSCSRRTIGRITAALVPFLNRNNRRGL